MLRRRWRTLDSRRDRRDGFHRWAAFSSKGNEKRKCKYANAKEKNDKEKNANKEWPSP